ncbi:unannotated protein [freshwater metagenome]|uniref:Unannotated protein n=1 Tax=freshwater metagenome TaxID=449393 RepID=A0A6J7S9A8_9ZZZZ
MVIPLCFGASGSVRVIKKVYVEMWAPVVHILEPLMAHISPSCTARTLAFAISEPPSGSEYPKHTTARPAAHSLRMGSAISAGMYLRIAAIGNEEVPFIIITRAS